MDADLDLLAIWTVLETEAAAGKIGIHAVPTGFVIVSGEVLAGIDKAGNRHLLVPLIRGEAAIEDRSGRALQLQHIRDKDVSYISAICLVRELDDVFFLFSRELLEDLANSGSPAKHVANAFAKWKRLFADASAQVELSESQQIGILAELHILERLAAIDPYLALESWLGPSRSQHDFRRGSTAIEVKASLIREGRRLSISSVEQLNAPPDGELLLAYTRFEADINGDSLPSAISRIYALGVDATKFEKLLFDAGYRRKHASIYAKSTYRAVEQRFYDVTSTDFPKIVPGAFSDGKLPAGTFDLSYWIDITNEPPFPVPSSMSTAFLKKMVSS